jgi:hypothetical protein
MKTLINKQQINENPNTNCKGFTLTREGQIKPLYKNAPSKPNWPSSTYNKRK